MEMLSTNKRNESKKSLDTIIFFKTKNVSFSTKFWILYDVWSSWTKLAYIRTTIENSNFFLNNFYLIYIKAITIDEVLKFHNDFLDTSLKECMLTDPNLVKV